MRLAALSPAGQVLGVSYETDAGDPVAALSSLAEFLEGYPAAALGEATDETGAQLTAWAADLARLRRGELEPGALLDRRAAAFRPKPPRNGRTRRRPRRW